MVAEEKDDQEVAVKLPEFAAPALEWAADNGVAFDHGKTGAAYFHRKRSAPAATNKVGDRTVPLNKKAMRWLGVWLDSQLTLKEHHAIQSKAGKERHEPTSPAHRADGPITGNCPKAMMACV
jgi:hypothetical protein